MKLTEDQIKDLESRGIKPKTELRSAFSTVPTKFQFLFWGEFECEEDGSIASTLPIETNRGLNFVWLFDADSNKYATPIK